MQTVIADALIQDAASTHASVNLLPITLSFFLAEDAISQREQELYALKAHIQSNIF